MAIIKSTDADFRNHISSNSKVVIKYYADWCGSCKLFAPKYKRLSEDERFQDIVFLDINAEENAEARKEANVSNLPFFAIFKDGVLVDSVASNKEQGFLELLEKLN